MALLIDPVWLPRGRSVRWGVGISFGFVCPAHLRECRLEVYFENPCDGLRRIVPAGERPYRRIGTGLGGLTIRPDIDAGECGRFEVRQGVVFRVQ